MSAKKAAVMIYPYFSLQETTGLTSCLTIWYEREIDIFASSKEIIKSEDGFQVVANKTFEEFSPEDYDCLILPGILNPIPALFDEKNIGFLRSLAGKDIVIAAISSSPMLLAKAGLLENRKFTCGLFDEVIQYLDFIPEQNVVHVPVHKDANIITAVGFAFREFTVEVLRAVGLECPDTILGGVTEADTEEALTFLMGEEHFQAFLAEYNKHMEMAGQS
ncbi:MAG: DJ-1/PfpI family protein [Clostridia bacterium]|nr:DJ-1/PfpI family protein [Clostridia bacterium]